MKPRSPSSSCSSAWMRWTWRRLGCGRVAADAGAVLHRGAGVGVALDPEALHQPDRQVAGLAQGVPGAGVDRLHAHGASLAAGSPGDERICRMYRRDLATIHHRAFGVPRRRLRPGILALLGPVLERQGTVLELGCGSGALTRHLVAAGHRVLATDASPAMVELAGEAQVLVLPDDPLPPADAVVSVGHVLNYLGRRGGDRPGPGRHRRRPAPGWRAGDRPPRPAIRRGPP